MKRDKVKIEIIGTSKSEVTGSCIKVSYRDTSVLIDCGSYQGCNKVKTYEKNKNFFRNKRVKDIKDILITHIHADHIGNLPRFHNLGGNAKIHLIKGSLSILDLMLRDSLKINNRDSEYLTKICKRKMSPLFNEDDVQLVIDNCIEHEYNTEVKINKYMSSLWIPSGHIYKAGQIILKVQDGNFQYKIGIGFDLGNINIPKILVDEFVPIGKCDLFIGESTYAMKDNKCKMKHRKEDLRLFEEGIVNTLNSNGSVLVATFSLQRSTEILYELYKMFGNKYQVVFDTPLGVNIMEKMKQEGDYKELKELTEWNKLKYIKDFEQSKEIMSDGIPKIIVSSSGFLEGGKALLYLTTMLENSRDMIISCGYSSEDSNMGKIKRGESISIISDGVTKTYSPKCKMMSLQSFSSHMQHEDMVEYYSNINCKEIVLTHGEISSKIGFIEELQKVMSSKNKNTKVYLSEGIDKLER